MICYCIIIYAQLTDLALANIGSIQKRGDISKKLSVLSTDELQDLVCNKVCYTTFNEINSFASVTVLHDLLFFSLFLKLLSFSLILMKDIAQKLQWSLAIKDENIRMICYFMHSFKRYQAALKSFSCACGTLSIS